MEQQKFLGKGIKFPIQVNPATGRFVMSDGLMSVKESVYLILMTQKQERWIHPDFGSRILSYTFMDTSSTRLNMMARELEETILGQEPRIASVDIQVEPHLEKGCLFINISYVVAENNTRDNLVFPFYLYAEEAGDVNGSPE
jgi:hypothetical protein